MNLTRPLVLFDLETTGTDTLKSRIVEIALLRIDVDGTRTERTRRLNPECPIPPEVTAIHGITDADVANEPTFRQISRSLLPLFEGADVGGFNAAAFDIPMLYEAFARVGIVWKVDLTRIVDAGVIFKVMEPRDLSTAVQTYCGRPHEGAHGALADIRATADVLEAQLARYPRFADPESVFLASRYDDEPPVDVGGKLKRDAEGYLVYAFGKNEGKRVCDDTGYAQWMLSKDFPSHTCALLREELARVNAR